MTRRLRIPRLYKPQAAYLADGRLLGWHGTGVVRVWGSGTEPERSFELGRLEFLATHPTRPEIWVRRGGRLDVVDLDGKVIRTAPLRATPKHSSKYALVGLVGGGSRLALARGPDTVQVLTWIDAQAELSVKTFTLGDYRKIELALAPDGTQLLVAYDTEGLSDGALYRIDLESEGMESMPQPIRITAVGVSPTGRYAVGSIKGFLTTGVLDDLRERQNLLDFMDGGVLLQRAHTGEVRGVLWAGRRLVSLGDAEPISVIKVWDTDNDAISRLELPGVAVNLALSPDQRRVAAGLESGLIELRLP